MELILVNDGSEPDLDSDKLDKIKEAITTFRYISLPKNQGKGQAVRTGAAVASYDYVAFTDIDFPYEMSSFVSIVEGLSKGADIISFVRDESYYAQIPKFRRIVSKVLRWTLKTIYKLPVSDTQAGLKAFSKQGTEILLQTETTRYLFDIELFKRASRRSGIKIVTYPAQLRKETVLQSLSLGLIWKELNNFIRIWFM